jgi:hypothetical protein
LKNGFFRVRRNPVYTKSRTPPCGFGEITGAVVFGLVVGVIPLQGFGRGARVPARKRSQGTNCGIRLDRNFELGHVEGRQQLYVVLRSEVAAAKRSRASDAHVVFPSVLNLGACKDQQFSRFVTVYVQAVGIRFDIEQKLIEALNE